MFWIQEVNILIDYTQIPFKKVGVGIYALNLIKEIHQSDERNKYFILKQDDDNSLNFISKDNFEILKINAKLFRNTFFRTLLEQLYIPYLAIKNNIDAIHSLHYSFPLLTLRAKNIVTFHDMTFFLYPHVHTAIKRYYFKFFIWLGSILADRIITVSESTLKDFLSIFTYRKECIKAIHLGKNDAFKPDLSKNKVDPIVRKHNIHGDYLLFIGTIEPRKNIKNLILAFNKLAASGKDLKLVIVGKKGWHYEDTFKLVKELNLSNKIIFTGFIDEDDKPYLISGCKIFIYPSIYEGFGIPVLEALSCGIPTITSNVSSLPEVAGNAAMLIDPTSTEQLYDAINKLLGDQCLYNDLKEKSVTQASQFSWQKTARETIDMYKSLA